MKNEPKRTCAAIMFSDIVGYTALMGEDQELAFQLVKKNAKYHQEVIKIHHGKLIKELGDGVLCYFTKAEDALAAAYELQQHYFKSKELSLRIGIHFGEVILDRHDVFGDAVNIASRLQTLGSPGSVLFSHKIREDIDEKSTLKPVSLGKFKLKNVKEPLEVFALCNEGLVVPKRGEMLKLLESRLKKVMVGGLVLLTILLTVVLGMYYSYVQKNPSEFLPTVGVLPFNEIKPNGENATKNAENLTTEIITILTNFPELWVSPKSRTDEFKKIIKPDQKIFSELNVNYLITGEFHTKKDNNLLKINLYSKNNDIPIWEEKYEINNKNILEIESNIATNIALKIGIPLTDNNIRHIDEWKNISYSSHDHYRLGREYYFEYKIELLPKAISEFRKSLDIYPNNALAWAGLADAYNLKYYWNKSEELWKDSAVYCSLKAIEIDSTSAVGYKSLAVTYNYQGKYDKSLELNNKALALNPNFHQAIGNKGSNLFSLGNLPEALKWQSIASGYNPKLYIPYQNMGWAYRLLGNNDMAISYLKKSLEKNPARETYEQLGLAYIALNKTDSAKIQISDTMLLFDTTGYKNFDEKIAQFEYASKVLETAGILSFFIEDFNMAKFYFENSIGIHPNIGNDVWAYSPIYLAYIYKKEGNSLEAENLLNAALHLQLIEISNDTQDTEFYFNTASIYAIKGDLQNSAKYLTLAVNRKWVDQFKLINNPVFREFKSKPEFKKIILSIQSEVNRMNQKLISSN
jgi:class 3 adenylate cyclase/TolB-like protein